MLISGIHHHFLLPGVHDETWSFFVAGIHSLVLKKRGRGGPLLFSLTNCNLFVRYSMNYGLMKVHQVGSVFHRLSISQSWRLDEWVNAAFLVKQKAIMGIVGQNVILVTASALLVTGLPSPLTTIKYERRGFPTPITASYNYFRICY
jgi:hypothetical protein